MTLLNTASSSWLASGYALAKNDFHFGTASVPTEELKSWLSDLLGENVSFGKVTDCTVEAIIKDKRLLFVAPNVSVPEGGHTVQVIGSNSTVNTQTLVRDKVSYAKLNDSIYIPQCGIFLKQQSQMAYDEKLPFTPQQQLVFLYVFYRGTASPVSIKEISEATGYSIPMISSAFDLFESMGVGYTDGIRKKRLFEFTDDSRAYLFNLALPRFISPVKRRIVIGQHNVTNVCITGDSALARYSMLDALQYPVYAVSPKDSRFLKDIPKRPYPDRTCMVVETWSYDPMILAKDGIVDPISLAFSLKHETAPRVIAALEMMLQRCLELDTVGYSIDSDTSDLPLASYPIRGISDVAL